MKKVAISQSNYIPWKGYFNLINMVDEFVLYDDMQYTRRDWRNRNKIKTPNGLLWLTIPVEVKGKYFQKINKTIISDVNWAKHHWATIKQFYHKTKYFNDYKDLFESFYLNTQERYLSKVNYELLKMINGIIGIDTKLTSSSDYEIVDGKIDRLISIVKQTNGSEYISGPAAKDYITDESVFTNEGIKLSYIDYSGYLEYEQLYPPFEHGVSILDVIFNVGPGTLNYLNSRKEV